tara:strand:+ start:29 stop:655 length:627 start_codon:yes stop_codon:yes gene_type:complete
MNTLLTNAFVDEIEKIALNKKLLLGGAGVGAALGAGIGAARKDKKPGKGALIGAIGGLSAAALGARGIRRRKGAPKGPSVKAFIEPDLPDPKDVAKMKDIVAKHRQDYLSYEIGIEGARRGQTLASEDALRKAWNPQAKNVLAAPVLNTSWALPGSERSMGQSIKVFKPYVPKGVEPKNMRRYITSKAQKDAAAQAKKLWDAHLKGTK